MENQPLQQEREQKAMSGLQPKEGETGGEGGVGGGAGGPEGREFILQINIYHLNHISLLCQAFNTTPDSTVHSHTHTTSVCTTGTRVWTEVRGQCV